MRRSRGGRRVPGERERDWSACSEFVERDLVGWDTEAREHPGAGLDHHRRAAEVVFHGTGIGVRLQVLLEHHLMDETGGARPSVFRQRRRECEMEAEIRMPLREA